MKTMEVDGFQKSIDCTCHRRMGCNHRMELVLVFRVPSRLADHDFEHMSAEPRRPRFL